MGQMPIRKDPPCLLHVFFILNEYAKGAVAMDLHTRATQYEMKASVINILSSFYSFENEDLYKHLDEFLDVCGP